MRETSTVGVNGFLRELLSDHAGHDDVAEQEIERAVVTHGDFQRLLAIRGLEHGVPIFLEHLLGQAADAVFVFGDENRLGAAKREGGGAHRLWPGLKIYTAGGHRQFY